MSKVYIVFCNEDITSREVIVEEVLHVCRTLEVAVEHTAKLEAANEDSWISYEIREFVVDTGYTVPAIMPPRATGFYMAGDA